MYRPARYARYRLRRFRDGRAAPSAPAFELEYRDVPARKAEWLDPIDVFDARDVARITREWQSVLD
jgi:hypothetical protein